MWENPALPFLPTSLFQPPPTVQLLPLAQAPGSDSSSATYQLWDLRQVPPSEGTVLVSFSELFVSYPVGADLDRGPTVTSWHKVEAGGPSPTPVATSHGSAAPT